MNSDVKELWIAALTSGEYEQGQRALCRIGMDGQKYWCCLGVLCDLAIKAGVDVSLGRETVNNPTSFALSGKMNIVTFDQDSGYPPPKVVDWAGLNSVNPSVDESFDTLASMNDSGNSFSEIADTIRTHL